MALPPCSACGRHTAYLGLATCAPPKRRLPAAACRQLRKALACHRCWVERRVVGAFTPSDIHHVPAGEHASSSALLLQHFLVLLCHCLLCNCPACCEPAATALVNAFGRIIAAFCTRSWPHFCVSVATFLGESWRRVLVLPLRAKAQILCPPFQCRR